LTRLIDLCAIAAADPAAACGGDRHRPTQPGIFGRRLQAALVDARRSSAAASAATVSP